jgi:Flp pilus assembly protein TadD
VEKRIAAMVHPTPDLLKLAVKIYLIARDLPASEKTLQRLIEAAPDDMENYNSLAQFYLAQGKLSLARTQFETILKRDPGSAGAHTMLGMIRQTQGDPKGARAEFETAVRLNPQAPIAANNLAMIYASSEATRLDEALQLAQVARVKLPDSPMTADTLAYVYYKKGMNGLAIPLLEGALQRQPNNAEYHFHLGLVYAQAGEDAKARKSLQTALTLDPRSKFAGDARRVIAGLIY